MTDNEGMPDQEKFRLAIIAALVLVVLVLASNLFLDQFVSRIGEYARRRAYYEKVISQKDLSLHRGMYWKGKE